MRNTYWRVRFHDMRIWADMLLLFYAQALLCRCLQRQAFGLQAVLIEMEGWKEVITMLKQMKYQVTVNALAPYRSGDGCMEPFK